MSLTPVGSAADDVLLDAIRRGLQPGDPVARLLADWSAAPARAVAIHVRPPTQRRPVD